MTKKILQLLLYQNANTFSCGGNYGFWMIFHVPRKKRSQTPYFFINREFIIEKNEDLRVNPINKEGTK